MTKPTKAEIRRESYYCSCPDCAGSGDSESWKANDWYPCKRCSGRGEIWEGELSDTEREEGWD